ncbi:transport and Golgi organization protein 1 homolog [Salvelinus namaycush]|uniref:Transport and Golgi organization protein 1 homolog n=1 Tax=Salvelinus namaycush TaxID=8040 RepID=A0A8U0QHT5_SALNM|nr:transport and Golgi organization protein 1 homolog [Salvelinus namaycush]
MRSSLWPSTTSVGTATLHPYTSISSSHTPKGLVFNPPQPTKTTSVGLNDGLFNTPARNSSGNGLESLVGVKQLIFESFLSTVLLCRGKAFSDFTGPDCRFLSFKKGETIYVYYKLSGQRTNICAGSDQLVINHIYTEKELEIPAEETDIVCFDTGHDKFDSYAIDSLLGSSLLLTDKEESVQVTTETLYLNKSAESTTVEVDEPPPEVTLLENDEIDRDVPEDIDKVVEVPDNDDLRHFEALESSLPQPETLDTKGVESNTVLETTAERIKDYLQKDQQRTEDSVPYSVVEPEEGEIKETPSEPEFQR